MTSNGDLLQANALRQSSVCVACYSLQSGKHLSRWVCEEVVVPRQSGRAIALLRRFRVLKGMLVPMFACVSAGAATLGQKAHSPAGCRLPAATLYACMHRVLCEARMSHDCNHEVFHYAYWLSTVLPPLRQLARNTTLSAFYLCTLYGVGCLHYLF